MKSLFKPGLTVTLLAVLLVSLPVYLSAASLPWVKLPAQKYESSEFKVSIQFPGDYEENIKEKTGDDDKITRTLRVTCKYSGNSYTLNVTKHPITFTDTKSLAQTSLTSFTNALNGELISQETYTQKGNDGLDATIYLSESDRYVHYRVILIDRFQYQLVIIDKKSSLSDDADDFMSSFKMKN